MEAIFRYATPADIRQLAIVVLVARQFANCVGDKMQSKPPAIHFLLFIAIRLA
jgi:hypothetical protein